MTRKDKPDLDHGTGAEAARDSGISRRDVLLAGTGAAAAGALPAAAGAQSPAATPAASSSAASSSAASSGAAPSSVEPAPGTPAAPYPAKRTKPLGRPYNIVLIISDEEAYHLRPAEGYTTPAREQLQLRGTTFRKHYIGAAMCTPSRGVMFSGQPPQINGVYDQMELGFVPSLSTEKPSLGTIFKKLGYTTAYFGKFELRKDIIYPSTDINYTDALQEYGFDTFAPDGDKIGTPDQAYDTDTYTGSEAVRWLRTNAQQLNEEDKPWLLIVSFISPHDIMYGDANEPGKKVQASKIGMTITPPPDNTHFARQWKFPQSPSHFQPLDAPGRPPAQLSYWKGWSAFLGDIPNDNLAMWNIYYNYYLNLIRDNDRNLQGVVDALSALDLWDSTVVFRTSDHGELGGSHGGLRGKGPLPYEQECHVPAVIVHPEYPGGKNCEAITSHIDLIPTLVGLTDVDAKQQKDVLDGLPGRDFSSLLKAPDQATANAIRKGVLFNYVGIETVDADYMIKAWSDVVKGGTVPPFTELKPNTSLRGFISFVYDGRYKFARYYAPDNFNTPTTLEQLLANNDIELFDLETDPDELKNLGADPQKHKDLIMRMNALLNETIAQEVGVNDGSFLPAVLRQKS